jgi:hypothetical protein
MASLNSDESELTLLSLRNGDVRRVSVRQRGVDGRSTAERGGPRKNVYNV